MRSTFIFFSPIDTTKMEFMYSEREKERKAEFEGNRKGVGKRKRTKVQKNSIEKQKQSKKFIEFRSKDRPGLRERTKRLQGLSLVTDPLMLPKINEAISKIILFYS